jgi:hypothetical protein
MKKFKEPITKTQRVELAAWIEKLTNGQLDAVKNMAAKMLLEREKAFWENPPEDYWRSIKHACGHSGRFMFSLKKTSEIDNEALQLGQHYCIQCLYQKLDSILVPELTGTSLKQKEYARVIRNYTVSMLLNNFNDSRLRPELPNILAVNQSRFWIETRGYPLDAVLDFFRSSRAIYSK